MTPARRGRTPGAPAARGWREWRLPALLVAVIVLGGAVVALLAAPAPVTGELDPRSYGPAGSHALAALLAGRGQDVTTVTSASAAAAQARAAQIQGADVTLVITSPRLLTPASIATLATMTADEVIVAPDSAILARLAPAVTLAGSVPVGNDQPRCGLAPARLAGGADMGGLLLVSAAPGSWRCYPAGTGQAWPQGPPGTRGAVPAFLVRYASQGRTITVLGTGTPLTNRDLGSGGNAALALNLLDGTSRILWLVPSPTALAPPQGQRSLISLIPRPAGLVALELAVAVLLAAAWRARRFGPLVSEPLPVVIHASETVEGHGRLYRSRRARDRAAAALRSAALLRLSGRLGLPPDAPAAAVCRELATRSGRGAGEIDAILFGPVPHDDAALVALAADLDTLEGQVLTL